MIGGFSWKDGERTIHFGRGRVADAPGILGDGYVLLTTARSRALAPDVVVGAATIVEVGPGLVDELAGELVGAVPSDAPLVVALGGGRVIDTAKSVAAVHRTRV